MCVTGKQGSGETQGKATGVCRTPTKSHGPRSPTDLIHIVCSLSILAFFATSPVVIRVGSHALLTMALL